MDNAIKTLLMLGATPELAFRDILRTEGCTEADAMGIVSRMEREGWATRTVTRGHLVLTMKGLRKAGVCI